MAKDQDLSFQRGPRPEKSEQRRPNQAANFFHKIGAWRNSVIVASRVGFPTGTAEHVVVAWKNKVDPRKPGAIDVSYNVIAEIMATPAAPICVTRSKIVPSIQRVMTGLCKHRHIVAHFDQP